MLFRESGFAFTRLDGSMAQKKRAEAVQCFQSSRAGSPTVMLLSLKAGGVGLNLTAASRVFLMDPVSTGLLVLAWLALGAAPVVEGEPLGARAALASVHFGANRAVPHSFPCMFLF